MPFNSPRDLLQYELSAIYDGEQKIARMLGEVAGQIQDEKLADLLRTHEQETQQQIVNVEQCCQVLDIRPQQVTNAVIDAIRNEYVQVASQQPTPNVLTMFILANAMKVEHYEIATYRGLVDKALLMGDKQAAHTLQTNLAQEEETAGKLERLSHDINQQILTAA